MTMTSENGRPSYATLMRAPIHRTKLLAAAVALTVGAMALTGSAQDVAVASPPGTFQDAPDVAAAQRSVRVFFDDGRYEERYATPTSCRPYLAQRFGTWARETTREGDVIVVTWQRAIRVTGGTAVTTEIAGCTYRDEHRETRPESSTVRWAVTACTADERAASTTPCVRVAGRAWYRTGDAAAPAAR